MPDVPLILKLKRQEHKGVAIAQDIILKKVYRIFPDAVFHGGTAIWRCYQGNRFSEDVDLYLKRDIPRLNTLFKELVREGFQIKKKKIGKNSLYSTLARDRTTVRLEALFLKKDGILADYLTSEGMIMTVISLSPEALVLEKAQAYLNRKKVRDLYDTFFLLRHVKTAEEIAPVIRRWVDKYSPPVDEKNLKVIIIEGLVPSSEKMLEYIRRWEQQNTK